jgi:hypothetical protein
MNSCQALPIHESPVLPKEISDKKKSLINDDVHHDVVITGSGFDLLTGRGQKTKSSTHQILIMVQGKITWDFFLWAIHSIL